MATNQKVRGANACLGVSQNVASGNYVGAGISVVEYFLGAGHVNPDTVEGVTIIASMVGAGVGSAIAGAGFAAGAEASGGMLVGIGIISAEIGGVIEGTAILDSYVDATKSVVADIAALTAQADTDDAAFQNYITQAYLNAPLIASGAVSAAFQAPTSLAQGFKYVMAAAGIFAASWLIF